MTNDLKLSTLWNKSMITLLASLVFVASSLAAAADDDRDRLFDALKSAANESEARSIEGQIWESWLADAPTLALRDKVESAMQRRESFDLQGAKDILDEVVAEAPNYSEGWNQRAFVLFLQGNYEESLEDIERTLALEPRHFGALSGQALIHMTLGRIELGQDVLKKAVKIHPYLKERSMLLPQNRPGGVDL